MDTAGDGDRSETTREGANPILADVRSTLVICAHEMGEESKARAGRTDNRKCFSAIRFWGSLLFFLPSICIWKFLFNERTYTTCPRSFGCVISEYKKLSSIFKAFQFGSVYTFFIIMFSQNWWEWLAGTDQREYCIFPHIFHIFSCNGESITQNILQHHIYMTNYFPLHNFFWASRKLRKNFDIN